MKLNKLVKLALIAISGLTLVNANEIDSQQAVVNGHPLHYYKIGANGSPLVLLTGYATTSNFWNTRFVECLAREHQVYLFDYAGINTPSGPQSVSIQSMASDVNQLAKQLALDKPALVGWSMGGGVALQASFSDPALYQHLYLLSPIVPYPNQDFFFSKNPHPPFKSDNDVLNYVFNNNLANYNAASLSSLQAQFIQPQLKSLFPAENIISLQEQAKTAWIENPETAKSFRQSQVPASFYIPEHDRIIRQSKLTGIINSYANSTVIQVNGSGHAVSWEYPLETCQSILESSRQPLTAKK